VAALEGSLNGGEHEERQGIGHEDKPGRPQDVAGIGDEEDPPSSEEVREDPEGMTDRPWAIQLTAASRATKSVSCPAASR
jgi:hypothetical protein